MKKINSLLTIFLSLLFFNACSSVVEGLGGVKKKKSDEFLVEKKAPLVLPPSFGELPEPGTKMDGNIVSEEDTSNIENIINQGTLKETGKEKNNSNNSIEESIIEKINE